MTRDLTDKIPEPFQTMVKHSKRWRAEGKSSITQCLSLFVPKTPHNDIFCMICVEYDPGFRLFKELGFGEILTEEGVIRSKVID
jgi:hypothetical protein